MWNTHLAGFLAAVGFMLSSALPTTNYTRTFTPADNAMSHLPDAALANVDAADLYPFFGRLLRDDDLTVAEVLAFAEALAEEGLVEFNQTNDDPRSGAHGIVERALALAPRERKVAEQMKSLPECYQTCFRNENGKVGVNIDTWDLDHFCDFTKGWIATCNWINYHVRPCIRHQCQGHMDEATGAGRPWMLETCGK